MKGRKKMGLPVDQQREKKKEKKKEN